MWRPDDWEKVKPRNTSEGCASGAYNNGVEAGADAIIEALIKQGRFNYAGYGTTDFPDARWGWFVFIPEG